MIEKFCMYLIDHDIIPLGDKDTYAYGLKQMFYMGINIIITILLGVVFDLLLETIVFMGAYIPIRSFAGGHHMDTQLRCFFSSIVIIIFALFAIMGLNNNPTLCLLIFLVSGIIIFIYAPVENQNKPFEGREEAIYCKKARCITLVAFIITIIGVFIDRKELYASISVAVFTAGIMLLLGIIKNKLLTVSQVE